MEHRMPFARFEALLDSHGADFAHWPAADVGAAKDLLSQSADARAALESAQALDRLLDLAPVPPLPSADLVAKILAARPSHAGAPDVAAMDEVVWTSPATIAARAEQDHAKLAASSPRRYLPAAALAASLVLGVLSGAMVQSHFSGSAADPTVGQLFALSTQVASLPLEMREPIE